MRKTREICVQCDDFVVLFAKFYCAKKADEILSPATFIHEFLQRSVPKNCSMYAEHCMENWNKDEKKA